MKKARPRVVTAIATPPSNVAIPFTVPTEVPETDTRVQDVYGTVPIVTADDVPKNNLPLLPMATEYNAKGTEGNEVQLAPSLIEYKIFPLKSPTKMYLVPFKTLLAIPYIDEVTSVVEI